MPLVGKNTWLAIVIGLLVFTYAYNKFPQLKSALGG